MLKPQILTVIACMIGLTFSVVPLFIAGTAVLIIPIAADTGLSRGDLSSIIATALVTIAIGAAFVGRLIGRYGPRKVIIPSIVLFACSLAAFASVPTFGWAVVAAAMVGFFGAGASQFAYVNVLPLWFDRKLGLALGFAMVGIGLGNTFIPVTLQAMEASFSWRSIFLILSGTVLCVSLPSAIWLLRVPRGQTESTAPSSVSGRGVTARQAVRSRHFWQLAVCFLLATTAMTGVGIHLTALMTDRGHGAAEAARLFSLWGISLAVARFGGGVLLDYIDARIIGGICMLGAATGCFLLATGAASGWAMLAIIFIALAHGLDGDLLPYVTRRYFGLQHYSAIYGLLAVAFGLGTAIGSILMGQSYDYFGSYTPMLWIIASAILASAALLTTLGSPPQTVSE